MTDGRVIPVAIELQTGSQPIEGSIRIDSGRPTRFQGWLRLISMLESAGRSIDTEGELAGASEKPAPEDSEV